MITSITTTNINKIIKWIQKTHCIQTIRLTQGLMFCALLVRSYILDLLVNIFSKVMYFELYVLISMFTSVKDLNCKIRHWKAEMSTSWGHKGTLLISNQCCTLQAFASFTINSLNGLFHHSCREVNVFLSLKQAKLWTRVNRVHLSMVWLPSCITFFMLVFWVNLWSLDTWKTVCQSTPWPNSSC